MRASRSPLDVRVVGLAFPSVSFPRERARVPLPWLRDSCGGGHEQQCVGIAAKHGVESKVRRAS